jgi:hypothetical protein
MRVAHLFVSATLLMSSGAAIAARDYFSRAWSEHDYDFEVRYRKNVQRILCRAFQHDVVLRTVHLPPFDPEWIVGVVRAGNGYRAFRLEASSFIWGAQESKNKQKLAAIRGIYGDRPHYRCHSAATRSPVAPRPRRLAELRERRSNTSDTARHVAVHFHSRSDYCKHRSMGSRHKGVGASAREQ